MKNRNVLMKSTDDAMRINQKEMERRTHLGTYCQRVREVIEVEIIDEKSNLT